MCEMEELINEKEDEDSLSLFSNQVGLGNYNKIRCKSWIRFSKNSLRLVTGLLTEDYTLSVHLSGSGLP